jgi:hypothetical protein
MCRDSSDETDTTCAAKEWVNSTASLPHYKAEGKA